LRGESAYERNEGTFPLYCAPHFTTVLRPIMCTGKGNLCYITMAASEVDDLVANMAAVDLDDTEEELMNTIKTTYGNAFSFKRLQLTLRALGFYKCLKCDVRHATHAELMGHLRKNGHWIGQEIKDHIRIFLTEQGFPEDMPLINVTDEDLSKGNKKENEAAIASRDILLVKKACLVYRRERR